MNTPSVGGGMAGNVTSSSVLSSTQAATCCSGLSSTCDTAGERSGLGGGDTTRLALGTGDATGVGSGVGTGLRMVAYNNKITKHLDSCSLT